MSLWEKDRFFHESCFVRLRFFSAVLTTVQKLTPSCPTKNGAQRAHPLMRFGSTPIIGWIIETMIPLLRGSALAHATRLHKVLKNKQYFFCVIPEELIQQNNVYPHVSHTRPTELQSPHSFHVNYGCWKSNEFECNTHLCLRAPFWDVADFCRDSSPYKGQLLFNSLLWIKLQESVPQAFYDQRQRT